MAKKYFNNFSNIKTVRKGIEIGVIDIRDEDLMYEHFNPEYTDDELFPYFHCIDYRCIIGYNKVVRQVKNSYTLSKHLSKIKFE